MIPIKIHCGCGQHYSFEVEPLAGRMPSQIACPVCGADGTEAANDVLSHGSLSPEVSPTTNNDSPASPCSDVPTPPARHGARPSSPAPEVNPRWKRGRAIMLGAFCPLLFFQLMCVIYIASHQIASPGKHIARILMHAGFIVGTYFGLTWSKRLLLFITIINSLTYGVDYLENSNGMSGFIFLIIAPIPAVLLFSKSVNEFIDHQNKER